MENDRGPPVKIPSGLDPQAYFAAQAVLAAKVPNRGGGPFGYPLAGGAAAAAALEGVGRTTVAKSGKSLKSSASLASSSSSSYDHNHSTASKNSFEALMAKAGRHLTAGAEAGDPVRENYSQKHSLVSAIVSRNWRSTLDFSYSSFDYASSHASFLTQRHDFLFHFFTILSLFNRQRCSSLQQLSF